MFSIIEDLRMYFRNLMTALWIGQVFAESTQRPYALYGHKEGYIVRKLTRANSLELEIIKP